MSETKVVLRNMGKIDPDSIDDYINAGGYESLKAVRKRDRREVLDEITLSGLRGRGGAAFPTGRKWTTAFENESDVKYLICNADEGEPGTYKDRTIIENDPHSIIEGMLIAAHVIGAKECFIYVRGEYANCITLLRNALSQAKEKGLMGEVTISVVSGAGAYICGEGTAIVNSLEGLRGEPRLKPPSMAVAGLNKKPTIVNNVETFAAVPAIIEKGGKWYASIGAEKFPGTKLLSLSGDIKKKVCVEVSTDTTLREVIEKYGGGMPKGKKLKAVQLGGSSCGFLTPEPLDMPIDFDSLKAAGASLGSGAVYVLAEEHNIVEPLTNIAQFFRHESCGKCSPCREGTMRVCELVEKINAGQGTKADIELIRTLSAYMSQSCFCPLGQSATSAIMSALKLFGEDFDALLRKEA